MNESVRGWREGGAMGAIDEETGWWQASDDLWYPPEAHPDPRYRAEWVANALPVDAASGLSPVAVEDVAQEAQVSSEGGAMTLVPSPATTAEPLSADGDGPFDSGIDPGSPLATEQVLESAVSEQTAIADEVAPAEASTQIEVESLPKLADPATPEPAPPAPVAAVTNATEKVCDFCSVIEVTVADECVHCGTPYPISEPPVPVLRRKCRSCGAIHENNKSVCVDCGTPYIAAAVVPPPKHLQTQPVTARPALQPASAVSPQPIPGVPPQVVTSTETHGPKRVWWTLIGGCVALGGTLLPPITIKGSMAGTVDKYGPLMPMIALALAVVGGLHARRPSKALRRWGIGLSIATGMMGVLGMLASQSSVHELVPAADTSPGFGFYVVTVGSVVALVGAWSARPVAAPTES